MSFEEVKEQVMVELKKDYHIIPKLKGGLADIKILDCITAYMAGENRVSVADLKSKSRSENFPVMRYKIYYLTRRIYPKMSLKQIGTYFGRDWENAHSIVIYGSKQIADQVGLFPKVATEMERMEAEIKEILGAI